MADVRPHPLVPPSRRGERGFALLIVLWTLALLSLLISQLAGSGRQALRLAGNLRGHAELQALADGAVQEAGFHAAAAGPAHWAADGAWHLLRQGPARIRLRIVNEAGKVNPSTASLDLMTAMLRGCGLDQHGAASVGAAIVSWRFPDAQSAFGLDAYRRAGLGYAPPGQPFESLGELSLVIGVTPNLLACLAPHLSLYRDADPDPNAADRFVLRALTEVLGGAPQLGTTLPDESLIRVEAEASGADGSRARRVATLRMDPQAADATGAPADSLAPFRILGWSR